MSPDPLQRTFDPALDSEEKRLQQFRRAGLLDEDSGKTFERLVRRAVAAVEVDAGYVGFLTQEGLFLQGGQGLPAPLTDRQQMSLSHSLFASTSDHSEPLVLSDVSDHSESADHPIVSKYDVGAYLGHPLMGVQDQVVGVFCVLDREPHPWTEKEVGIVEDFAAVAQSEINLRLELHHRDRLEHKLGKEVEKRTEEVDQAQHEMLQRLARAAEHRHQQTGQHILRVSQVAGFLAEALDQPKEWIERLREAARLHDIGKIGIPDRILLSRGGLSDEEFEVMKKHTEIGAELLSGGQSDLMQMAERIARWHHERWDGTGYPDGLAEEEIPLEARIVTVADAFDAMTHDRPYQEALGLETAFEVIEEKKGAQFDPRVSEALLERKEEVTRIVEGQRPNASVEEEV